MCTLFLVTGLKLTLDPGSPTFAGITAVVTANVVLFSYIFVAWKEDQEDRLQEGKAKRKGKKAE